MAVLSEATWERVRELFPPEQHEAVARILETECGNNLPFSEKETSYGLERLRFAALKLSNGNMENLCKAVNLAKRDWRDLLVAKGHTEPADPPMPMHVVYSHQRRLQNEKHQPSRKDCRMEIKQRRSGHKRMNQVLVYCEAEAVHNDHRDQQGH
jgi:hypothetical protein